MSRPIMNKQYLYCFPKTKPIIVTYLGRHPEITHYKIIRIKGFEFDSCIRTQFIDYLIELSPVLKELYDFPEV
jgi:hypothetical protein